MPLPDHNKGVNYDRYVHKFDKDNHYFAIACSSAQISTKISQSSQPVYFTLNRIYIIHIKNTFIIMSNCWKRYTRKDRAITKLPADQRSQCRHIFGYQRGQNGRALKRHLSH